MRFKLGDNLRGQHQQIRVKQPVYRQIDYLHRRIGRDNDELIPCRFQTVIILNYHLSAVSDMTIAGKNSLTWCRRCILLAVTSPR